MIQDLVRRFAGLRVGVVGDMMVDHLLHGRPTRLSREAPVVVIQYERDFYLPGGAANCAANLLSLGARVFLFGALGADAPGRQLSGMFRSRGADLKGLVPDRRYATITKTRILAGDSHRTKQQIVRIDREPPPLPAELGCRIARAVASAPRMDAWLVPDYGYGTAGAAVLARMRAFARAGRVVVGTSRYATGTLTGLTAVTANETEALEAAGVPDAAQAGRLLQRRLKPHRALLLTRGNLGMLCFDGPGAPERIPASGSQEAVDVTGAGDTVCAVFTLALAAGANAREAARLANTAAGEVVMRPGAATLTPAELVLAGRNGSPR
jgi:rfaE bifunctional protein kinase chain/domain